MAQSEDDLYQVGDRVYLRDRGFGNIISSDRKSKQHTIRLDAGQTLTLFASHITQQPPTNDILYPLRSLQPNQDNDSKGNNNNNDSKGNSTWNLSTFQQFARSNPSDCDRIFNANRNQNSNAIIDRIQSAAKQTINGFRYIHALKYVETDNVNIADQRKTKTDDVFRKYGSRCTISMDLDFDKLVLGNDKFNDEFNGELASILEIDPSMIRIESVQKGSIIAIFTAIFGVMKLSAVAVGHIATGAQVCAAGGKALGITGAVTAATLIGAAAAGYGRRRWRERRPRRRALRSDAMKGRDTSIIDVIPGDKLTVDHNDTEYDARVLSTFENLDGQFVTVEYIGNTKPFWFKKRETLELNSSRLHFEPPTQEDIVRESMSSCSEILENVAVPEDDVQNKDNSKVYHGLLHQGVVEQDQERQNESGSKLKL